MSWPSLSHPQPCHETARLTLGELLELLCRRLDIACDPSCEPGDLALAALGLGLASFVVRRGRTSLGRVVRLAELERARARVVHGSDRLCACGQGSRGAEGLPRRERRVRARMSFEVHGLSEGERELERPTPRTVTRERRANLQKNRQLVCSTLNTTLGRLVSCSARKDARMIPSLPPSRPLFAPSASSSSSDDNIIDLGQFNHPAPVPVTTSSAAVPTPTETHGFADGFMKRIFTIVPPPSASAELASRGATPSLPAAARRTSNTAPTSRSSSPPPTVNKDASNVAQRSVGSALEGLRSSLDLGALPSWLGGSAPKAGSNALAKGNGRAQEGSMQDEMTTRSSFDDSGAPPIRTMPTAAHSTTPSSASPRPPPLISSFPTFDTPPSGPSSLSDRLLEAIEEPVATSPSSSATKIPRHQPARSQSSPDVPASLPTLFAATSTSSSGSTAHFIPPTLPTAPPLAHFDAPFPFLPQTSRAKHVRTPSFKQQNATALATSSFFNPSSRSTSPTGFGGPYLHRSATLNSIDELRGVQNRQGGVQKRPISSGSGWWREHKTVRFSALLYVTFRSS